MDYLAVDSPPLFIVTNASPYYHCWKTKSSYIYVLGATGRTLQAILKESIFNSICMNSAVNKDNPKMFHFSSDLSLISRKNRLHTVYKVFITFIKNCLPIKKYDEEIQKSTNNINVIEKNP